MQMIEIGPFCGATNALPYPSLDPRYRSTLVARAGELSGPSFEARARAFDTIVLGGLTAGVLDILDAFVVTGDQRRSADARAPCDRQRRAGPRARTRAGCRRRRSAWPCTSASRPSVATTFYLASLKTAAAACGVRCVRLALRAGRVGVHVPRRVAAHLRAAVCHPRASSVAQPARHSHARRRPADRDLRSSLRSRPRIAQIQSLNYRSPGDQEGLTREGRPQAAAGRPVIVSDVGTKVSRLRSVPSTHLRADSLTIAALRAARESDHPSVSSVSSVALNWIHPFAHVRIFCVDQWIGSVETEGRSMLLLLRGRAWTRRR